MNIPLVKEAEKYLDRIAIIDQEKEFTYSDLLFTSHQIASLLLTGKQDLKEERIAYLIPSEFNHVATQWGIWRAGGISVPLCISHPLPELEYVIQDAQVSIIIAHPNFENIAKCLAENNNCRFVSTKEIASVDTLVTLPQIEISRRALILYTSGTTGKPKGVVITHKNILSQVQSLVKAWGWQESDSILHTLPLHHIHGIINVLTCALYSGAKCHLLPKFDPESVWNKIIEGKLTIYMAVPTIYVKLINYWQRCDRILREQMSAGCRKMRLMVSGSAALPVKVLQQWQEISGHFLLERYGMTEIGMALSNPLEGKRFAGYVGKPLPGVTVRLVDERGNILKENTAGEIQIKGNNVFLEYWQKPEATEKAFKDGWFCTGDLGIIENKNYRILGRLSVDIIKTGGYKVSALEIEEVLRTHPEIKDCAVVGVKDEHWGERVCVAIIAIKDDKLTLDNLRQWAKEKLAVYKIPSKMLMVDDFPRNAMGKVMKPKIIDLFLQEEN
ncbi:acyl-CoA synthetase [Cyanobacterium aponinum]|uniref:AMP-binding protein n=1 Tax=Cyanobacterium aponinum 0216 TaxID=2676140 RepID=A0A844GVU9_9CHRO|nr:acyl-CoA synthetase [Cyanobacterium aponinum]MTF40604.1 AMP-binding protein [Cyanobacterium aponinum 0216]